MVVVIALWVFPGMAQGLSIDQAMQILQTTKPIPSPWVTMGATDPKEKAAAVELFRKQMDAIFVIGKARLPKSSRLLIPYLDYSTKDVKHVAYSLADVLHPRPAEDFQVTRNYWPVFSALLDIPGSSQVLMAYALDVHNPLVVRIAAFHVLRYSDTKKFKAVAEAFHKEFPSMGPHSQVLFNAIEDGSKPFKGITFFDPTQ
jgi:hypothetical protein